MAAIRCSAASEIRRSRRVPAGFGPGLAPLARCQTYRSRLEPEASAGDQSDTAGSSPNSPGEPNMISRIARASLLAFAVTTATASVASASTPYDGRWSLSIVTQRGACDTYNFPVDIANGQVSFPGLVRASGRVGQGWRGSRQCRGRRQVRVGRGQAHRRIGPRPLERQVGQRHLLGHVDRATVVTKALSPSRRAARHRTSAWRSAGSRRRRRARHSRAPAG